MSEMDRSTCEETVRRLNDFLDRELQESEMAIVREHINACEVCADHFEFNGSVLNAIKAKLVKSPEVLSEEVEVDSKGKPLTPQAKSEVPSLD